MRIQCRNCGFTLIELLVVLSIVAMLLSLALPRYIHSIDTSKEAILIENLHQTREIIEKFKSDTGRYPDSLEELVTKKYLRAVPVDPITESDNTWRIAPPEGENIGQVFDIHSGAEGKTRAGKPYAEL